MFLVVVLLLLAASRACALQRCWTKWRTPFCNGLFVPIFPTKGTSYSLSECHGTQPVEDQISLYSPFGPEKYYQPMAASFPQIYRSKSEALWYPRKVNCLSRLSFHTRSTYKYPFCSVYTIMTFPISLKGGRWRVFYVSNLLPRDAYGKEKFQRPQYESSARHHTHRVRRSAASRCSYMGFDIKQT